MYLFVEPHEKWTTLYSRADRCRIIGSGQNASQLSWWSSTPKPLDSTGFRAHRDVSEMPAAIVRGPCGNCPAENRMLVRQRRNIRSIRPPSSSCTRQIHYRRYIFVFHLFHRPLSLSRFGFSFQFLIFFL